MITKGRKARGEKLNDTKERHRKNWPSGLKWKEQENGKENEQQKN